MTTTGENTKRVREMSSNLFVLLYTPSIYPSAHKQLRRHIPNPFREFPCIACIFFIDNTENLFQIFSSKGCWPRNFKEFVRSCYVFVFSFFCSRIYGLCVRKSCIHIGEERSVWEKTPRAYIILKALKHLKHRKYRKVYYKMLFSWIFKNYKGIISH